MYIPGEVEKPKIKQLLMTSPGRKSRQTKNIFYSGFSRDYDKGVLDILADVLTVFLS